MGKPTPRNLAYRAECPHPAPCWCTDCRLSYGRVYSKAWGGEHVYCNGCGGTKHRSAKYCAPCIRVLPNKIEHGTDGLCRHCSVMLPRKKSVSAWYCNNRCRWAHLNPPSKTITTTCPWCWKSFQRNVKKGQRYCSQVCSQHTRSQLTIWHAIDRCHLPHCEDCGQVGGFNPFSAFICSGCSFERSKLRRHEGEAKRQAAMRAGDRSINWRGLGDRDNWICHLCRRSVPKQVGTPKKKNGATVDHLDPLSDGGPHQWENVALAHWSCNISRGARASEHGVQLRLIG